MLVLNGVIQKPTDAFTVSGSTITFASNLVTGDVINFIQILGNVLDLGVPSDSTVSLAKLSATGTKDSTTFLRGDNTFAAPPLGGITEADMWRLSANTNSGTNADITTNWERVDDSSFEKIGTGMTQSSGIFSFPSTGKYLVSEVWQLQIADGDIAEVLGKITINNSSYSTRTNGIGYVHGGSHYMMFSNQYLVDVTDTSNVKMKFTTSSFAAGTMLIGDTSSNSCSVSFTRLGDT